MKRLMKRTDGSAPVPPAEKAEKAGKAAEAVVYPVVLAMTARQSNREGKKMVTRQSLLTACGAVLGLVVGVAALSASTATRTEYLTFRVPVALPRVTLAPGTYVFEIANPDSGADIVLVRSRVTNEPLFMGFTNRIERPASAGDVHVTLGEAGRGEASRILAWYPVGSGSGHEFVYR
jgi:hypothetical protein